MPQINQVFEIVNSVAGQALGTQAITAVDTQSLVTLGNQVLSSNTNKESFLNTLVDRIGKTIISSRSYRSKFDFMLKDDMQYGAILQKINFDMPDTEEDPSWNLTNDQSIDQYKIKKPKVRQSLFTKESAWMISQTFTRKQLKTAFTSAGAMDQFIQGVYTAIQNKIEFNFEQLGRATLANYIAEVVETPRVINLLDAYNKAHGLNAGQALKAVNAKFDPEFLRFAIKEINKYSKLFTELTKGEFNDGTTPRHTPKDKQTCLISLDWEGAFETQMQYSAYNDGYVKLKNYDTVSYWQSIKKPESIDVSKRSSDGTAKTLDGIVGTLFDVEAMGIFKHDLHAETSPYNAKGEYYNTYWHALDMRFNDLSENMVVFTVADVA